MLETMSKAFLDALLSSSLQFDPLITYVHQIEWTWLKIKYVIPCALKEQRMNPDVQNKLIRHILTLLFVKGFLSIGEYLQMRDLIIGNQLFKL